MRLPELRDRLLGAAAALECPLSGAQADCLLGYLDLLAKWNKVYNLTAIRDPEQMLTHHLVDSLAVVRPFVRQAPGDTGRLLDVGSGGGLPGVVLATMLPGWQVTCVDAVAKKASFVRQVSSELALPNLAAIHARVEDMPVGQFDVVTSRAFASLSDFTAWSFWQLRKGGVWMAMKGRQPDDELAALPKTVEVFHVEQLTVPGLDAQRCIVWMRPSRPSF